MMKTMMKKKKEQQWQVVEHKSNHVAGKKEKESERVACVPRAHRDGSTWKTVLARAALLSGGSTKVDDEKRFCTGSSSSRAS